MVLKKSKVHGAKIWNELPPDLRVTNPYGLFNTKLKMQIVKNCSLMSSS